ncbi:MAG: hypothetical protein LBJ58_03910 [Tannerellaceae bacterium]|jgi:hypothetical protein|nr:hypothetical protein [Tannerellaceae bacterium]
MKKITPYILLIPVVCFYSLANAQVSIGTTGKPDPSAMLDMTTSTGKGLGVLLPLIPVNNPANTAGISSPADYLMIFSPYAKDAPNPGLNYWHGNKWNRFLNQTELYDSISANYIAQIVLFAEQTNSETTNHNSKNSDGTEPYKFPLHNIIYDSRSGYNTTTKEYIIPDDGNYEITCNVAIKVTSTSSSNSMQTYVVVDGITKVNDLVSFTLTSSVSGSVTYTAKFTKGQRISGAVGAGNWSTYPFMVESSSIAIVKY